MWFIIRHGETLHNRLKIKQGSHNSLLTLRGIDQIKSIAYRMMLEEENFNDYKLISSPMIRTLHSAQILQEVLGLIGNVELEQDMLLSEVDAGDYTNYSKKLIKEEDPDFNERKKKDFWNFSCPNGETYNQAYERFLTFFQKHEKDKNMIVVTHGCGIKFLTSLAREMKKDDYMPGIITANQNYFYCWDGIEVRRL